MEITRRHAMHLLSMAGNARNSVAQSEESLAALEREAERLEAEMGQSRNELETLGVQSGQARLNFESATETLKRLEGEIVALRETLNARRSEENALRAKANQFRGELAGVAGRRDSLQALIRNHSYSTDSVRKLLKPGAMGDGMSPVGTLADFLEVSGEHEGVVDEFLRDELNYVVVESWRAAEQGVQVSEVRSRRARDVPDSSREPQRQWALFRQRPLEWQRPRRWRRPGTARRRRHAAEGNHQGPERIRPVARVDSAQAEVRLPG